VRDTPPGLSASLPDQPAAEQVRQQLPHRLPPRLPRWCASRSLAARREAGRKRSDSPAYGSHSRPGHGTSSSWGCQSRALSRRPAGTTTGSGPRRWCASRPCAAPATKASPSSRSCSPRRTENLSDYGGSQRAPAAPSRALPGLVCSGAPPTGLFWIMSRFWPRPGRAGHRQNGQAAGRASAPAAGPTRRTGGVTADPAGDKPVRPGQVARTGTSPNRAALQLQSAASGPTAHRPNSGGGLPGLRRSSAVPAAPFGLPAGFSLRILAAD